MSLMRTRWAAVGAAVAVTLGAGGIGLVSATNPSGAAALVPITPCRITDTRTASQVGPKASPVGPNETYTIAAHGTNGNCTIPAAATGLSMNVTAVNASANTFLTFWGTGAQPTAANLNPRAGGPPTPNSVTTPLSATGSFNVYNKAGNVGIIIDIVGYYTDHTHDDRYYTKAQTDSALAGKANSADVYTKAEIDARKFINIDTMRDVEGLPANAPFGGGLDRFDTSLIVPPDYTPGTPMTLSINVFKSDLSPFASCQVDLRSNYVYAMHPSTATNFPGTLSGRTTVTLDAVRFDIETVDFTLSGAFAPGDSVTLGLFAAASGTTCGDDTAYQSAAIYYD